MIPSAKEALCLFLLLMGLSVVCTSVETHQVLSREQVPFREQGRSRDEQVLSKDIGQVLRQTRRLYMDFVYQGVPRVLDDIGQPDLSSHQIENLYVQLRLELERALLDSVGPPETISSEDRQAKQEYIISLIIAYLQGTWDLAQIFALTKDPFDFEAFRQRLCLKLPMSALLKSEILSKLVTLEKSDSFEEMKVEIDISSFAP